MILYKHNRSGKIYKLVTSAIHTEDDTEMVIYKDFPKSAYDVVRTYARPTDSFFEVVKMEDGTFKPRFEVVTDLSSIFTEEEKKELIEVAKNPLDCKDVVVLYNADYFRKWL